MPSEMLLYPVLKPLRNDIHIAKETPYWEPRWGFLLNIYTMMYQNTLLLQYQTTLQSLGQKSA